MPTQRLDTRTLWTLLGGNALTMIGIGFFLPILPLFITARGGAPVLVGLVFAAGVVGRAAAQYPAGWLADTLGRKPVIIGALLCYGLIFPLYLVPVAPGWFVGLRLVHAMTAGAYLPAATAMIADLTGPAKGRAFGQLRASDMVGLLLGPAVGGLVAGVRLDAVFLLGSALCLAATGIMLLLPSTRGRDGQAERVPLRPLRVLLAMGPVIAIGVPLQWTIGTYDTVWSLYITSRGGSPLAVGLSFASYALPIVVLGGLAGSLADRLGHLRTAAGSVLAFAGFASLYPFLSSVPLLIGLGVLEGALTVASGPALLAAVSRIAPPGAQGRTQGMFQSASYAAEVLGAITAGGLYGVRPGFAFWAASLVAVVGVSTGLGWGRLQTRAELRRRASGQP
ncbi:MAG TPA: MFS transporter [Candidatus Binatia bacterium]|nr:MFS transporter [Candidatus Binatia bacterium]